MHENRGGAGGKNGSLGVGNFLRRKIQNPGGLCHGLALEALALNVSEDTAIKELNVSLKLRIIKKIGKGRAVSYCDVNKG